ncbi:MAG: hypothetical protein JXQ74_02525 [Alphaproteobacteria bacterium]|nr:hypothetical protein [Alphaproteobacteria bacterium]
MQIFLLMLLSTFMGGYHYLSSPALNIGHDFLPESVRTKTLIMCVINEQKKALDDNSKNLRENGYEFEKTAPCAKSKDVITTKFCMQDGQISPDCYGQEGSGEESNYLSDHYFITRTDLPKDMSQSTALDYIKKMSGGLPNLGLLFKGEDDKYVVLNPQTMTETVSIPEQLIGANSLRKHQIVYFSHHTPSEVEAIAESSEWEALKCSKESDIKVFDGETQTWGCRPFDNFKKCFGDTIEDSKGNCIPNLGKKITCSSDERATFNYEALAWECKRKVSVVCQANETLGWNGSKYVCMYNEKFTGKDCEDLVFNDTTQDWETVRLGGSAAGYPCGACEINQSGTCDDTCFPDPSTIPENLCAGPNCAYECDTEEGCGWIKDCNGGQNCSDYKTIYWESNANKWHCVNCYPLKVKKQFKRGDTGCFSATIRDTEGLISIESCDHNGAQYQGGVSGDSCTLQENDKKEYELQCVFTGSGEFGEDGSGEKRFFCDTDDINDTNICGSLSNTTWAWYEYQGKSPGCMDPYDQDTDLQVLNKDTTKIPTLYDYNGKKYTFGCPSGYYRPRTAKGQQLQACKKRVCDNLPENNQQLTPTYSERRTADGQDCKAGYIDILRTSLYTHEGECFYCWIPPEDFEEPGPKERNYVWKLPPDKIEIEYFSVQTTTKSGQYDQTSTFEHYTACEKGNQCQEWKTSPGAYAEISCYKDDDGFCLDAPSAHNSPPGWQRTWSNGAWSDPTPNWCNDSGTPNFPQDESGQLLNTWDTKSQGRCPPNYQTKLNGRVANGVFTACLYCLPQPFKVSEVSSLLSGDPNPLPTDPEGDPIIEKPQQPGAWQLNRCYDDVAESEYSLADLSNVTKWTDPDYSGLKYAYAPNYCDISIVSEGCALGTKRSWVGGWSNCEPNLCRSEDKDRTGMNIPMLFKDGDGNYCVYMWRPPYNGVPPYRDENSTFSDWSAYYYKEIIWHTDGTNYIDYLNDHDHDGQISGLYPRGENLDDDGYYLDKDLEYNEDGHNYTWADETGWTRKQIWCGTTPTINDIQPDSLFPTTGQLEGSGAEACYNTVQPTLSVWKTCKSMYCESTDCMSNSEFKTCLFTECTNNAGCVKNTEANDFEFCTVGQPSISPWDPATGWQDCETNWCRDEPGRKQGKYIKVLDEEETCLYAWKPEYVESLWENWKNTYAFDVPGTDETIYLEEAVVVASNCCVEGADSYLQDGGEIVFNTGFKVIWESDTVGWKIRPNWCDGEGLADTMYPKKAAFYPWTAKRDEVNWCLKKTQASFENWGTCKTTSNCPGGDCKTDAFQTCLYEACIGSAECPFSNAVETSAICSSGDQISNWEGGVDGRGWLDCGFNWCDDATKTDDPALTNYPWTARVVGTCLKPVRSSVEIWNTCKAAHCPSSTCSGNILFQTCLYEKCKTDAVCLETTDPEWSLQTVQAGKPIKQVWDGTALTGGWGEKELNFCSGNNAPAENLSQLFVTQRTVESELCADIWLPDYGTWDGLRTKPTWESFDNTTDIESFDFLSCTGTCPTDAQTETALGCTLSFTRRTWLEKTIGWPATCDTEIGKCAFETPQTNFFRIKDTKIDPECIRYYRPTWDLWSGGPQGAWDVGEIPKIEKYCDDNPGVTECKNAAEKTSDGCPHSSLQERTWTNDVWPDTCTVKWCNVTATDPTGSNDRLLVSDGGCAKLWRPGHSVWKDYKDTGTWNAYKADQTAFKPHPCDKDNCPVDFGKETDNNECLLTSRYRNWNDDGGWSDCTSVTWCGAPPSPSDEDKRFLVDDGACGKLWRPDYTTWIAETYATTATWEAHNANNNTFAPYNCSSDTNCPTDYDDGLSGYAFEIDNTGCLTFKYRRWEDATGWLDSDGANTCEHVINKCTTPSEEATKPAHYFHKTDGACVRYYRPSYKLWIGGSYFDRLIRSWKNKTYNAWSDGNLAEMEAYCDANSSADECQDNENISTDNTGCTLGFLERNWDNAVGWTGCTHEIRECSGEEATKPAGYIRVASTDGDAGACMRYYRPTYALWKAQSGNIDRMETYCNGGTCTDAEGIDEDRTDCTAIGFTYNKWDAASGVWTTGCTNIDWSAGFENVSPATASDPLAVDDERFLVESPAGEASLWIPPYTTWNTGKLIRTWNSFRKASGYNTYSLYNCSGDENCPTDDADLKDHTGCPLISIDRTWTNAGGWSGCSTITWCNAGDAPTSANQRFFVDDGSCAKLWRPNYTIWDTYKGSATWDVYNSGGSFIQYNCTGNSDCPNTDATSPDDTGCTIPFLERVWADATGWSGCININWASGFSSPGSGTDDERFLVESPTGEASLWIPSYSVWSYGTRRLTATWNAYRGATGYAYSRYDCAACATVPTTENCPTTGHYYYREWTDDAAGWPTTCSINWCASAQSLYNNGSSGYLLESTAGGSGLKPNCAEASKAQPHRFSNRTLSQLRAECNGDTAAEDADCFYKSGYATSNYAYETPTQAECPSPGLVWDKIMTWNNNTTTGWGACVDRNCASNDIPAATGEPFTSNPYLSSYYQPTAVSTSCGDGYVEAGKTVGGDATKSCRFCQVSDANISCPDGMFAYYISGGQLKCDMPAPPTVTCSSESMTPMTEDGAVLRWGVPIDPNDFTSPVGTANVYHYYCHNADQSNFELHYFVPGTATDSYTCSTSAVVYNAATAPTGVTVTYGTIKIRAKDADGATSFYNTNSFIICPNGGSVIGWKEQFIN